MLQSEDFNDDRKDAGEIGAGHTVTAIYEIVPVGVEIAIGRPSIRSSTSPTRSPPSPPGSSAELLTVKLRYKPPVRR